MIIKTVPIDMNKVRLFADKKFWSLTELSKQAHLSTATLFALTAKRRQASYKTLHKLAEALEVKPEQIIKED